MAAARFPTAFDMVAIMVGGAIGVALRVWLSAWIANRFGEDFPWGTFAANVSGCLAIGLFAGVTGPDGGFWVPPWVRATVMLGVLGGFTTFSSFGYQTMTLFSAGQWILAGLNAVGSLVCCLLATAFGMMIANAWNTRL